MPKAGWYPDPADASRRRWWDGRSWTEHSHPGTAPPNLSRGRDRYLASPPRLLATPWRRLGARVLDGLILAAVEMPLWLVYVLPHVHVVRQNGTATVSGTAVPGMLLLFFAILSGCYEVGMIAVKGATFGKMIVGIRVEHEDGTAVQWGASGLRWFLASGIFVIPVLGIWVGSGIFLVSAVLIFTDVRRQTVWDKGARTIVVRELRGIGS
jgi:uncharacterized RDD family membrane protein YckC